MLRLLTYVLFLLTTGSAFAAGPPQLAAPNPNITHVPTRVLLHDLNLVHAGQIYSFTDATTVCNFFGSGNGPCTAATSYFNAVPPPGPSVLKLLRFSVESSRAHLYGGGNLANTSVATTIAALNAGTTMTLPWNGQNITTCFNAGGTGGCHIAAGASYTALAANLTTFIDADVIANNPFSSITASIAPVNMTITVNGQGGQAFANVTAVSGTLYPGGGFCYTNNPCFPTSNDYIGPIMGQMLWAGGTPNGVGYYSWYNTPCSAPAACTTATNSTLATSGTGPFTVTVTTAAPHGLKTGGTFNVTIAGVTPGAYNGNYLATVTGASTFTYSQPASSGAETVPGTWILNAQTQVNSGIFSYGILSITAGTLGNNMTPAIIGDGGVHVPGADYVFQCILNCPPTAPSGGAPQEWIVSSPDTVASETITPRPVGPIVSYNTFTNGGFSWSYMDIQQPGFANCCVPPGGQVVQHDGASDSPNSIGYVSGTAAHILGFDQWDGNFASAAGPYIPAGGGALPYSQSWASTNGSIVSSIPNYMNAQLYNNPDTPINGCQMFFVMNAINGAGVYGSTDILSQLAAWGITRNPTVICPTTGPVDGQTTRQQSACPLTQYIFTTPGAYTVQVPNQAACTTFTAMAFGGGGHGVAGVTTKGGNGGGSGAFTEAGTFGAKAGSVPITPGATLNIQVGAGGTGTTASCVSSGAGCTGTVYLTAPSAVGEPGVGSGSCQAAVGIICTTSPSIAGPVVAASAFGGGGGAGAPGNNGLGATAGSQTIAGGDGGTGGGGSDGGLSGTPVAFAGNNGGAAGANWLGAGNAVPGTSGTPNGGNGLNGSGGAGGYGISSTATGGNGGNGSTAFSLLMNGVVIGGGSGAGGGGQALTTTGAGGTGGLCGGGGGGSGGSAAGAIGAFGVGGAGCVALQFPF